MIPARDVPPSPRPDRDLAPVPRSEIDQLVAGEHGDPHHVLGAHPHAGSVTVRALRPLASTVVVRWRDAASGDWTETPLEHEHEGVFAGVLPTADVPDYRLLVAWDGAPVEQDDPYRFLPTLGEVDQIGRAHV